mmetsp:Transcript_26360/g.73684  ORF Transcript_26360/g.73684 Transcript_26360/m.73684 type:complete len:211 (-) Transcript_26360:2075-2707(-)
MMVGICGRSAVGEVVCTKNSILALFIHRRHSVCMAFCDDSRCWYGFLLPSLMRIATFRCGLLVRGAWRLGRCRPPPLPPPPAGAAAVGRILRLALDGLVLLPLLLSPAWLALPSSSTSSSSPTDAALSVVTTVAGRGLILLAGRTGVTGAGDEGAGTTDTCEEVSDSWPSSEDDDESVGAREDSADEDRDLDSLLLLAVLCCIISGRLLL